jgi:IS30 family transposase
MDKKIRIGVWEVDTIIGKYHQGAIITIVDRKSKFTLHENISKFLNADFYILFLVKRLK